MASSLNTPIALSVNPTLTADLGTFAPILAAFGFTLSNGTSSLQADSVYCARRTASTSGDSLDLSGGGLLQPDQSSFSIAEICFMLVINRDSSINITVGGGSNAVVVVGDPIKPGGWRVWAEKSDPAIPVTAGTGDIVKVVSASGTPSYDILIIGRSA